MSTISPPFNKTSWPDLGLALQIVYSPNSRQKVRLDADERSAGIVGEFTDCLDALLHNESAEMVGKSVIDIPYVSIGSQIERFAKVQERDYEGLVADLRDVAKSVLRMQDPGKKGNILTKFGQYLEGCRDNYWEILIDS